ncbi:MAG: hypothetical protein ACOYJG_05875 [Prevotella sp.]
MNRSILVISFLLLGCYSLHAQKIAGLTWGCKPDIVYQVFSGYNGREDQEQFRGENSTTFYNYQFKGQTIEEVDVSFDGNSFAAYTMRNLCKDKQEADALQAAWIHAFGDASKEMQTKNGDIYYQLKDSQGDFNGIVRTYKKKKLYIVTYSNWNIYDTVANLMFKEYLLEPQK